MLFNKIYKLYYNDQPDENGRYSKKFTVNDVMAEIETLNENADKWKSISTNLGQFSKDKDSPLSKDNSKNPTEYWFKREVSGNYDNKITSFQDFKELLSKFRDRNQNNNFFFRGEPGPYIDRQPSIYRDESKIPQISDRFYSDLSVELGDLSFATQPLPTQLAHLQHYQAPTRLLDVSLNPLVALFFAVEKDEDTDRKIFLYAVENSKIKYQTGHTTIMKSAVNWIDQKVVYKFIVSVNAALNERFSIEDGDDRKTQSEKKDSVKKNFNVEELDAKLKKVDAVSDFLDRLNKLTTPIVYSRPCAIYRDLTSTQFVKFIRESTRMQRQQGAFIMPKHFTGYEKESMHFGESINHATTNSIEYVIPAENVKKLRGELATLGINAGTSYPDIEHYAKYLKEFYQEL